MVAGRHIIFCATGFIVAAGPQSYADDVWRPMLVRSDESGGRNIPNYRFDNQHTAGGYWQITDTNWRHYAPLVDIDLNKWPNALSAPEQLQGQVAGIMWAKEHYLPWVPYNSRLRRHLAETGDPPPQPQQAAAKEPPQQKEDGDTWFNLDSTPEPKDASNEHD